MIRLLTRVSSVYLGLSIGDFLARYFGLQSLLGTNAITWVISVALLTAFLYLTEELTLGSKGEPK